MGLLAKNADYTDRDMASLLVRVRGLIRSVCPDWTDDKVANVGNIIVESFCFTGDVLGFYQDKQAEEAFWTTAKLRRSLLSKGKMVAFKPAGAKAATVNVQLTLGAPVPSGRTVTFSPPVTPTPVNPTVAKTEDTQSPIVFQLLGAVTLAAGQTTATAVFENSERQGPELWTSSGLPNQEFTLAETPYLDDSGVVSFANGAYTEVADFLQSGPSDRHYVVAIDENERATFRFGNGVNGAIPVGSGQVTYKTGGGSAGNVAANTIRKLEGSFVDSAGDPVSVTITNNASAAGGDERDSVEEIREKIPASLRTLTRTISREDFENNAKTVSGVERALMLTKNEDNTIGENAGSLLVVPSGLGFPSNVLKNAVLTAVTQTFPCPLTFTPSAVGPRYVDIGVSATLFLRPGYQVTTVRANIIAALQSFFALRLADGSTNPLIDFGLYLKKADGTPSGKIALSDLFNVVRDVDGVRSIGDGINDFRVSAYRVVEATTAYSGGSVNATLIQALAHTDVTVGVSDFPRLKATVLGGAIPDVTLTIDGNPFPPGP